MRQHELQPQASALAVHRLQDTRPTAPRAPLRSPDPGRCCRRARRRELRRTARRSRPAGPPAHPGHDPTLPTPTPLAGRRARPSRRWRPRARGRCRGGCRGCGRRGAGRSRRRPGAVGANRAVGCRAAMTAEMRRTRSTDSSATSSAEASKRDSSMSSSTRSRRRRTSATSSSARSSALRRQLVQVLGHDRRLRDEGRDRRPKFVRHIGHEAAVLVLRRLEPPDRVREDARHPVEPLGPGPELVARRDGHPCRQVPALDAFCDPTRLLDGGQDAPHDGPNGGQGDEQQDERPEDQGEAQLVDGVLQPADVVDEVKRRTPPAGRPPTTSDGYPATSSHAYVSWPRSTGRACRAGAARGARPVARDRRRLVRAEVDAFPRGAGETYRRGRFGRCLERGCTGSWRRTVTDRSKLAWSAAAPSTWACRRASTKSDAPDAEDDRRKRHEGDERRSGAPGPPRRHRRPSGTAL